MALLMVSPAAAKKRTVAQKKQIARTHFQTAERMREALNGRPEKDRSVAQYKRVIDAYRSVYFTAPTSNKADASIVATAELMADMGRQFHDAKALKSAIAQYEFLRREYPGSKYRIEALFTMAQIYREDLGDDAQAHATFEEFLKRYPHSELVGEARAALKEMDAPQRAAKPKKEPLKEAKASRKAEAADDEEPPTAAASSDAAEKTESKAETRKSERVTVTGIRHWSTPDYTRIAVDLGGDIEYEAGRVPNPERIFFDLHNTHLSSTLVGKSFDVEDGFLHKIRVAQFSLEDTRLVLELDHECEYSAFLLPNPTRLIVDIRSKRPQKQAQAGPADRPSVETGKAEEVREARQTPPASKQAPATKAEAPELEAAAKPPEFPAARDLKEASEEAAPKTTRAEIPELSTKRTKSSKTKAPLSSVREAQPTANGDRSLIRALGLKIGRIVVDAGHGGHDTGTIGPNGLYEKDLVLEVALRLGKLLENRLGAEVVYTRDDDTFIPLETRTAIANQSQADLFISIHANSSRDPSARGVETYYLNFTSSSDALEVAARENAVSEKSIHELQDLVKKIALKEKIEESREFATDVQQALFTTLAARGMKNRGVKKAPFIVLIGANMPSILAEISFVSNPTDAKKLKSSEQRQKIAEALYRGVAKYVSGLSGLKVASKNTSAPEPSR